MATPLSSQAERLARSHRRRQQVIAAKAVGEIRRLWRFGDWRNVFPYVLTAVRAAMLEAARGAQAYVTAAAGGDPYGTVAEHTFADTASDGRPLDTLLGYPDFEVSALVAQGMEHAPARAVGERHLERIVATQVADAARVSTGVAVANDRAVSGYIRLLTPPSCSRCIILAGSWYRWNAGFKRHPQCDCVHVPASEVAQPISPKAIYDAMSDDERRKAGWSGHDQRAIEDGADLYQTTNYRRELQSVTVAGRPVKTTRHGTTTRALAGSRLGARIDGTKAKGERYRRARNLRITPEQIYLEAERLGWDRDQTLRQLKRHGYIL